MSTVTIDIPTEAAILHIVRNMRLQDRREIWATLWGDVTDEIYASRCAGLEYSFVLSREGVPVCFLGARSAWEGVWSVGMFATPEWPTVALSASKFMRRDFIPVLKTFGAHRLECKVHEENTAAIDWVRFLGGKREGTHHGFGRNGETFYTYGVFFKPEERAKNVQF